MKCDAFPVSDEMASMLASQTNRSLSRLSTLASVVSDVSKSYPNQNPGSPTVLEGWKVLKLETA